MTLLIKDRVKEISTTVGTGPILVGTTPVVGFTTLQWNGTTFTWANVSVNKATAVGINIGTSIAMAQRLFLY